MPSFCHTRIRLVAVAVTLACTPYVAEAQRPTAAAYASSGTDSLRVKRFLAALQSAISRDDSVAVSKLFQYPSLPVLHGSQSLILRRREQLFPIYRSVFNPAIRQLILTATLDSLWADYRGVTLGKGRLWFQIAHSGDPLIASVNTGSMDGALARSPARMPHNEEL
jgi:hypothetical protein